MKCPNCGTEIPDGYMYCFKCGYAIQMVPDYEVDVENRLDESRDRIAGSLDNIIEGAPGKTVSGDRIKVPVMEGEVRTIKNTRIVLIILAALILIFSLLFFVFRNNNSYTALIIKANFAYDDDRYEDAAELYAKAYSKYEDEFVADTKLVNNFGRALLALGDNVKAREMFSLVLSENISDLTACQGMIDAFRAEDNNSEVNNFIESIEDEKLYKIFKDYMTLPPTFALKGGEYEESARIALTSENSGDIYYTMDGTEPTAESSKYEKPIVIDDEGEYHISAIFVNSFGMSSEAASESYTIYYKKPADPSVEPEGGGYLYPAYITAEVSDNSVIYYTTDGSEPNEDSPVYEKKLPMMIGDNTYKFMAVSDKGVSGNVISRKYSLGIFNAVCTPTDAINYVTASLVATGALQDIYGTIPGVSGHYSYTCTTAAKEGNRVYYLVDETFIESDGNNKVTGTVYAVDVESCVLYRTRRGPDGEFYFSLFY